MRMLRKGWMRTGVMATVVAGVAAALVVFGVDSGHSAQKPRLLSGSAWLSSAKVGQATLLDGNSAEVSAQVQVAPAGAALDVVQQGNTAYAVDRTAGTVRRVDGATFDLTQPQSPIPDARAGLVAIPGADSLYTLDTQRGVLAQTDPRTLTRRGELITLATQLAAGTAAVDDRGRLWAIDTDTGDLIRIAGGRRTVHRQVVQPGRSVLTLAGGAPVVVDTVGRKAITFDPDTGKTRATMELDLRPDDQIEVSGSPHASRLYVVAARGTLYVCQLIASSCDTVIPLGAGNQLGAPVEAANRVFIPDYSTGQVWIVDLAQSTVVAQPQVLTPAGPFQLLTRDGIVFYNDPHTERAGVIHLDGSITTSRKYDPNDPTKGVHSPNSDPSQPQQPQQPQNPPSNPDNNPQQPDPNQPQPQPNPNDPRQPNPTNPQPRPNEPRPNDPRPNPNDPRPNPNDPQPVNLRIAMSNTEPMIGERVTLQVTNPGGPAPTAAHWTFGDNGEGDGLTVEHQWTVARTYQVGVQATMPDGRTATESASITVKAKPTVTLTVNLPGGGGTISGGPINCPGVCTAEFDPDAATRVTLTAAEDSTHLPGNWSGACSGAETTCDVVMDASKTVGYQFRQQDPTITYTITPPNGGTIKLNGTACPGTCQVTANRGQNVSLEAIPNPNFAFESWTNGCANPAAPSCTISSETDRTIAATFRQTKFTLTVSIVNVPFIDTWVDGSPGIDCRVRSCTYNLDPGTIVDLTEHEPPPQQTCNPVFIRWHDDCAPAAKAPNCRLTMDGNKTATAEWRHSGC